MERSKLSSRPSWKVWILGLNWKWSPINMSCWHEGGSAASNCGSKISAASSTKTTGKFTSASKSQRMDAPLMVQPTMSASWRIEAKWPLSNSWIRACSSSFSLHKASIRGHAMLVASRSQLPKSCPRLCSSKSHTFSKPTNEVVQVIAGGEHTKTPFKVSGLQVHNFSKRSCKACLSFTSSSASSSLISSFFFWEVGLGGGGRETAEGHQRLKQLRNSSGAKFSPIIMLSWHGESSKFGNPRIFVNWYVPILASRKNQCCRLSLLENGYIISWKNSLVPSPWSARGAANVAACDIQKPKDIHPIRITFVQQMHTAKKVEMDPTSLRAHRVPSGFVVLNPPFWGSKILRPHWASPF